jgi:LEA14-like dessication related protein/precorrin-6B methylase 2
MTVKQIVSLVAVLAFLTGCESKSKVVTPPKPTARMAGLQFQEAAPDSATLLFDVEVDNPQPVSLRLLSLNYTITSDANTFTSTIESLQTTVPAESNEVVSLAAKVNYTELLNVLNVKPGSTIPYKAQLALLVDAPTVGLIELPASNEGEIELPDVQIETQELQPTRSPDVIYVPTPQEVVDKMLEMVEVKKDDIVYDLGCGDGRIVVTAAKKYGCKAFGFDIDPQRIKESLENVEQNGVGDLVTIQLKDIFTLDISEANVVTLYLLPSLNVKLIPQLEKLKPGSRIVSHDFATEGVQPDKVVELTTPDGVSHKIYLWTTPLKKVQQKDLAPVEGEEEIQ